MTSTKVRSNSVRGRKNQNPNKPIKKKRILVMLWSPGEKKTNTKKFKRTSLNLVR
jgi:hypothetical protein